MLRITRISWLFAGVALAIGCVIGCNSDAEPAADQVDETTAAEPQATAEPSDEPSDDAEPEATQQQEEPEDEESVEQSDGLPEPPKLPPPEGAKAMPKPNRTWVDAEKGIVIVDGYVSLREGMLEMFACPVGTKEHESIVAVYSWAQVVHAALLAVGAETGTPVQFNPEFKPPTGTQIDIEVRWLDEAGEWQSIKAQDWIRDLSTDKAMTHPWVFAGSGFWKDERSGEMHYLAEVGDFICVSNFSTATLDIPAESSQVNDGLMFEPFTEKIPPLGTPVRLVLKPRLKDEGAEQ
jgi:hypothetical protein